MSLFGKTIKIMLMERGITSRDFAKRINLSPTSLSKIVQGVTRPRQANLTRILEELCETPEEEQQLLSAFAQVEGKLSEETAQLCPQRFQELEEQRVRRYLQMKSRSIAFREAVAGVLRKMGVSFQGPHEDNEIICDFYLPGPPRIAIECKANPNRDWDRTLTTVAILKKHFDLSTLLIVVPNAESIRKTDRVRINKDDGRIVPLSQLKKALKQTNIKGVKGK
jgi:transcriptional regulator with XRE-family HTH domain